MALKSKNETTNAETTKIMADDNVDTDAYAPATTKSRTMIASHGGSQKEVDDQNDYESRRPITKAIAAPNAPCPSIPFRR